MPCCVCSGSGHSWLSKSLTEPCLLDKKLLGDTSPTENGPCLRQSITAADICGFCVHGLDFDLSSKGCISYLSCPEPLAGFGFALRPLV